jgi:ribosomal protein S12 methylthiotransferase
VPEEVKQERVARFMEKQATISKVKLKQNIGKTRDAIIDALADSEDGYIIGRTSSDAPDIDGLVYIEANERSSPQVGDIVTVKISDTDEYDMWGALVERSEK